MILHARVILHACRGGAVDGVPVRGVPVHDGPVTVKHATASVFVFCQFPPGWRLGLILHPIFGRLMIPGGHVEPSESQQQAALREVGEEAGLTVRLIEPPGAAWPEGLGRIRVAQPWWIVEQPVPADHHLASAHVHLDHLYVAVAESPAPVTEPAHPFGWHAQAELAGLHMFDDTRQLAAVLFPRIAGMARQAGG
jgi:8-oxo-dGTP pyrophosphatase MutT (NUDIX family)